MSFFPTETTTTKPATWGSHCTKWDQNGETVAGGVQRHEDRDLSSLHYPLWIALNSSGDNGLFVADQMNGRILKFEGSLQGQLIGPEGLEKGAIFVDRKGHLYRALRGKVMKYETSEDTTGVQVAGGETEGSGLNQLGSLIDGFAVDDYENLFISDTDNHRVIMWMKGAIYGIAVAGVSGEAGSDALHLDRPTGIYLDSEHYALYVVDQWNQRIQRFFLLGEKSGETVAGGNEDGNALSQLGRPMNVVLDREGNLYIAEYGNGRITRWLKNDLRSGGTCVLGCTGEPLNSPFDLKFDKDYNLIISETSSYRILKFKWASNYCQ